MKTRYWKIVGILAVILMIMTGVNMNAVSSENICHQQVSDLEPRLSNPITPTGQKRVDYNIYPYLGGTSSNFKNLTSTFWNGTANIIIEYPANNLNCPYDDYAVNGDMKYHVHGQDYVAEFSDRAKLTFARDKSIISLEPQLLRYTNDTTSQEETIGSNAKTEIRGIIATFHSIANNTELNMTFGPSGVNYDWKIMKNPIKKTLEIVYSLVMSSGLRLMADGITITSNYSTDREIYVMNLANKHIYTIPRILAQDTMGNTISGHWRIVYAASHTIFLYAVIDNSSFLKNACYPIWIDPAVGGPYYGVTQWNEPVYDVVSWVFIYGTLEITGNVNLIAQGPAIQLRILHFMGVHKLLIRGTSSFEPVRFTDGAGWWDREISFRSDSVDPIGTQTIVDIMYASFEAKKPYIVLEIGYFYDADISVINTLFNVWEYGIWSLAWFDPPPIGKNVRVSIKNNEFYTTPSASYNRVVALTGYYSIFKGSVRDNIFPLMDFPAWDNWDLGFGACYYGDLVIEKNDFLGTGGHYAFRNIAWAAPPGWPNKPFTYPVITGNYITPGHSVDTDFVVQNPSVVPVAAGIINLPDLTISSSDIIFTPSPVATNTQVTISGTIHNIGAGNANSFVVRFYNGDPAAGGTQIGTDQTVSSLSASASTTVSISYTFTTPDKHNIYVVADADDQIFEVSEANNKAFNILVVGPDLTITTSDISFAIDYPGVNVRLSINAVIHNIGGEDVTQTNVVIRFYNGDPTVGGTQIGGDVLVGPVPKGGSVTATLVWMNPPKGTYNIYVVVDATNIVIEADETNNIAYRTLIMGPDLTLSASDITFSPSQGIVNNPVTISAIVHNIGSEIASNFVVRFYDGDPATGGTQIGTDQTISSLAAGSSVTLNIQHTFSTIGTYNIFVVADVTNTVVEVDELNNKASNSIFVWYASIQAAIDAASPSSVIQVPTGTYYEHLTINKPLTLIGAGVDNTIIDGSGTGIVISITANNVDISKFTIRRGEYGILPSYTTGVSIHDNVVTDNAYGIYNDHTTSTSIQYNTISYNTQYGIYTNYANDDTIRHNTISYNNVGAKGHQSNLSNCFNWNTFYNNTIGYIYDPSSSFQPYLLDSNIFEENVIAIKYINPPSLIITNNILKNNFIGIYGESGTPEVAYNIITKNAVGIYLNVSNPNIHDNNVYDNSVADVTTFLPPAVSNEFSIRMVITETQRLMHTLNEIIMPPGIKNSLSAKLESAMNKLSIALQDARTGDTPHAQNMLKSAKQILNAFINDVEAQIGKKIASVDANLLIMRAQALFTSIENVILN